MSDEEAAAYISRCSGEFESSGWGPASGESGRWCTELGIGCRLRATDPVDFGVSGSASGFGEVPLSPFTQRALNAYEAMVAASGAAGALRNGTGWVECGEPGLAGCGAYDPHELMQEVERAIARANALLAMEMLSAELIRRQAGMSEGSLGTNRSHALIRTVGRGGLGVAAAQLFLHLARDESGEAFYSGIDIGLLFLLERGGLFVGPVLAWGYTEMGGSRAVVAGSQELLRQLAEGAGQANRYQWHIASCGGFRCGQ
jgi:hypothetical protein